MKKILIVLSFFFFVKNNCAEFSNNNINKFEASGIYYLTILNNNTNYLVSTTEDFTQWKVCPSEDYFFVATFFPKFGNLLNCLLVWRLSKYEPLNKNAIIISSGEKLKIEAIRILDGYIDIICSNIKFNKLLKFEIQPDPFEFKKSDNIG